MLIRDMQSILYGIFLLYLFFPFSLAADKAPLAAATLYVFSEERMATFQQVSMTTFNVVTNTF